MVTCDAVDILCDRLFHPTSNEVRYSCAVALGYLTFNRTASRLLLHNCRNTPQLFNTLMSQLKLGDPTSSKPMTARKCIWIKYSGFFHFCSLMLWLLWKVVIAKQFVESFQTALALGLPKMLVRNRVKFFDGASGKQASSAMTYREETSVVSFYGSRSGSKQSASGQNKDPDGASGVTRAKTASLALRSQSAPMAVMLKSKRTDAETVETRAIKTVRPTLGPRPHTQFDLKRKVWHTSKHCI